MSDGLNLVVLIGGVATSELRYTQSNQAVLSIRMATSKSFFDKNSKERKEKTEWHTVVVWGARAEALSKFLSKGSRINVTGELQTRSWEDKQGNKRYSTEIVANDVILLGGGQRNRQDDEHQQDAGGSANGHGESHEQPYDSDVPF